MKAHTTFKCGGVAEFFFIPDSIEDLLKVISASKKYNFPFFILGGGANLLVSDKVSDKGIPGVTVSMANLNSAYISQNTLITEAGLSVTKLGEFALENSLSGLEFIHGKRKMLWERDF
ncbi:MAG: hypothetical protein B6229_01690 [Spirochaetaceae bacterium 4572_7]|nr:MAG: hypothetical protein B6229_01690 [Spirochaetaceae bacterium 4572_7]